ncbi:MAG TPA: PEGA domain-containing protein [Candidatus Saccharimonadales bacterium]|nr:PEGA domain-containing protein [Candidatus Saccharimonadales bacterium]
MDYLDPKKELKQRVTLLTGYVLVAVAIAFAALVLLYQAYGFTFGKNGTVIQNGLLFFSSQPNPANIYINGKLASSQTNTRLFEPSGIYQVELTRAGYRNWYRRITVDGGSVEHFDYPLLIPNKLITSKVNSYSTAPGFMSQSLNQKYILIETPGSLTSFDLYDLSTPAKPVITNISLPANVLTPSITGTQSLKVIAWADDNQHILLEHLYDGKTEYILLDTADTTQSVNLTTTFNVTPTSLSLVDNKYNNYYFYDSSTGSLTTASLSNPTPITPVLTHALAYESYGSNEVLYATDQGAKPGKVLIKLFTTNQTYTLTDLPASTGTYLLNLTTYNGTLYAAVGSTSGRFEYIYQDPIGQLQATPGQYLAPSWVLHVTDPNYLSFSKNAQFIMTENDNNYAVYDIQNSLGYLYSDASKPLDPPQLHATWMDGDRLIYISNGKVDIQDYDNNNQQTLVPALANYVPAFSSDYKYMYTLSSSPSGQFDLNSTPLMIPSDL